ncbi:MAG: hypothetical protein ACUVQT_03465, partial [bacterium]
MIKKSYFDRPKYGWIGYTETDLVQLCASNTQGDFCYALTKYPDKLFPFISLKLLNRATLYL